MRKSIIEILLLIICLPLISNGQSADSHGTDNLTAEENIILDRLAELAEVGIEMTEDSLILSKEFIKVLEDSSYRASLYPENYTWEQAIAYMQNQELKKAFWFFINLYPENDLNKELVLKSILTYDQLFDMEKVMVNTFYTYSFMDPEVSIINNGKPEIIRPDIHEAKLRTVKTIVGYIRGYREQQQREVSNE